ncbi:MAG TPA: hypothetical protein VIT65_21685 [Microlunatus sp.]
MTRQHVRAPVQEPSGRSEPDHLQQLQHLAQLTEVGSPKPRNDSPASATIAPVAATMTPLTTREVMFGMISLNTIGHDRSPENFAAVTNSRERRG